MPRVPGPHRRRPGLVSCPGCGARLKQKAKAPPADASDDTPRKKKRKKKGSGPNYALLAAAGGGFAILAAVAVVVAIYLGDRRRPAPVDNTGGGAGGAGWGGVVQAPEPKWTARADPPMGNIRPKDDLAIPLGGDAVFAAGQAPFVADLEADGAAPDGARGLAVYDLRTGQRTASAKAIALHSSGGTDATDKLAALGPDGKTLAVRTITTVGTGRQRSVVTEAVIYRVGQDAPVLRVPTGNFVPWMAFGRDEDQLLVLSAPPRSAISLTAYELKKPAQPGQPNGVGLEIPNVHNRWRNGMGPTETLAVSPGRNYLAFGEGRAVDLVRLSDLKWAGKFDLPGDCQSVAFSADGSELAVHSIVAPPKKSNVAAVNQWSTFSLADGKLKTQDQVKGGVTPGPILAAGPKPGLAVHGTRDRALVADTHVGAQVYSAPFHAAPLLRLGPAARHRPGEQADRRPADRPRATGGRREEGGGRLWPPPGPGRGRPLGSGPPRRPRGLGRPARRGRRAAGAGGLADRQGRGRLCDAVAR